MINAQNISRDATVPRSSVDVYFSIMIDTLLGHFLPAYRPNVKVREQAHPKFYWFDPGVARAAAGLLFDPADRIWQGAALETLVYHELRTYNHVANRNRGRIWHWVRPRTRDGRWQKFCLTIKHLVDNWWSLEANGG